MTSAVMILWFLSTLVTCWGAAVVVRGLRGEPIRKRWKRDAGQTRGRRFHPTWRLVGLGSVILALGGCSMWAATVLQTQNYTGSWFTPFHTMSLGIGVFGMMLGTWGTIGDRSKGRQRCPRCWYDLSGVSFEDTGGGGITCSECGREIYAEAGLLRTRRSRVVIVVGVLMLSIAAAGWQSSTVYGQTGRAAALLPNRVLVRLYLGWEDHPIWIAEESEDRLDSRAPRDTAYFDMFLHRVSASITDTASFERVQSDLALCLQRLSLKPDDWACSDSTRRAFVRVLPVMLQAEIDLKKTSPQIQVSMFGWRLRRWNLEYIVGESESERVFVEACRGLVFPEGFFRADAIYKLTNRVALITPHAPDELFLELERTMRMDAEDGQISKTNLVMIAVQLRADPRFMALFESILSDGVSGTLNAMVIHTLTTARGDAEPGELFPIRSVDRLMIKHIRQFESEGEALSEAKSLTQLRIDPMSCEKLLSELVRSGRVADRLIAESLIGLPSGSRVRSLAFVFAAKSEDALIRRLVSRSLINADWLALRYRLELEDFEGPMIETFRLLSRDPDPETSGPAAELLGRFHILELQAEDEDQSVRGGAGS